LEHTLYRGFQVGTVLTLVLDHWTGHCYLSLVEEELFMAWPLMNERLSINLDCHYITNAGEDQKSGFISEDSLSTHLYK
jgi:hypothetical protein